MAKVSLFLDKRRPIKDGSYPIKLRVTHKRKRRYYSTGFYSDPKTFDKIIDINKTLKGELKITQTYLLEKLSEARLKLNTIQVFSFDQFERLAFSNSDQNSRCVLLALESYENELRDQGRIKSSISYRNARKSFCKFLIEKKCIKSPKLLFEDVKAELLEEYENWMLDNNNSFSTIGIYCRNLRRVFNIAIQTNKDVLEEWYPFARKRGELDKYVIPQSINRKRALSFDQMQQIIKFQCNSESMEKCKDLFVFSYLCQGVNLTDILELKWENYNNKQFSFIRHKVKRKRKANQINTFIYLHDKAIEIIEKWGNPNRKADNYIFPFYDEKMDDAQKEKCRNQLNKNINKHLRLISQLLNLNIKPTFYFARHTYSTIMRNSGANIEFISEALGHSSIITTQNYLSSFEEYKVREYHSKLT